MVKIRCPSGILRTMRERKIYLMCIFIENFKADNIAEHISGTIINRMLDEKADLQ